MIIVNEKYALAVDSHNYQLMEYRTIDPSKAANWNDGIDKKGNRKDATVRTEWVALIKYYPPTTIGLASALQEIAHREVRESVQGDIDLAEYIKQLHVMHESIKSAVEGALT